VAYRRIRRYELYVGLSIMDLDAQFDVNHLFLNERKCRTCGETKNLIEGFYRTRKDKGQVLSSYSYECKKCTIDRIKKSRKS
jgi:hypothetical protein